MGRRRVTSFRESLVKTCYSKVLERFVRIYLVEEETAAEFLSDVELSGLTKEEYALQVVTAYFAEPKLYQDLEDEQTDKLTWELYDLILDSNPYLDPDNLEQVEIPTPRRTRKRKPDLKKKIEQSVLLYGKVKRTLEEGIVGQHEAVGKVVEAVGAGLLRAESAMRPICALLLCGESGVGKTEIARQLASALGSDSLIRIDCAEYGESHQLSRLIGAPAGYVGYDDPTYLERKLDSERLQVLLFDEFEKADPKLWTLLLSVLEDGLLTTSHSTLSFRNCVVLLTSNLGAKQIAQGPLGFATVDDRKQAVLGYIRKELPIEFVNRLTDIVFLKELSVEEKEQIAGLELARLRKDVEHLVHLTWTDDAPKGVVGKVLVGKEKGARSIRKYMDRLHSEIAQQILSGRLKLGSEFRAG